MHIVETGLEIQREPFARPFGFKGSAFHEKWNLVVRLRDADGHEAFGVGGLAVLWSDAAVFAAHTEMGGNLLQASVLEYALQLVKGRAFADPMALFDAIEEDVFAYGKTITQNADLRRTFVLIVLVALDQAAWFLHAQQMELTTFDEMIPDRFRSFLSHHQSHVAIVPAVSYSLPMDELQSILDAGAYVLKIKIGHPGDEAEMVKKDMAWLSQIHKLAVDYDTEMTDSGKVLYYLDANGRYGEKDSVARLLDYAEKGGFLDRIVLIEEPFQRPDEVDVQGLPARFAGDESIETVDDVRIRLDQGYGAMAVKPAGKTMSLVFRMVEAASQAGVPCFVADNACVPVLVEWNKNVASRLPAFPGVKGGLMESNGPESYATWNRMLSEYPMPDASWLRPQKGAFVLGEEYYEHSGGIFEVPKGYADLLLG
ncbi:MAG: L-alanine-DL-glutamate epimerase [Candidatus Latescibacteria bacterium]|jgi:L-alanine-DL-glutamate epimerase-like enolase superfamily enzyme|nr:L-alanine-DL-glutamate epimerase [Candidatus Latescibacterota bacterium]